MSSSRVGDLARSNVCEIVPSSSKWRTTTSQRCRFFRIQIHLNGSNPGSRSAALSSLKGTRRILRRSATVGIPGAWMGKVVESDYLCQSMSGGVALEMFFGRAGRGLFKVWLSFSDSYFATAHSLQGTLSHP